jgi:hypothetical protein
MKRLAGNKMNVLVNIDQKFNVTGCMCPPNRLKATNPKACMIAPMIMAIMPYSVFMLTSEKPLLKTSITPRNPKTIPNIRKGVIRSFGSIKCDSIATHRGNVAKRTAARPEFT